MVRLWKLMDRKQVALIILLIFLEAAGFLALPTLASEILNMGAQQANPSAIYRMGIIMFIINALSMVFAFISTFLSARQSQGLGHQIRQRLFRKVMAFSAQEMSRFGSSTLLTRTTNDVMQIQLVTMLFLRLIIMSPIVMVVSFLFAVQRQAQLAWVFAVTLPLIVICVALILRAASPIFRSIQKRTDKLNQVFREGLTGIRVIRAFNTTAFEEERFDQANQSFRNASIRANSTLALILPTMIIVMGVSNILIFYHGTGLITQGQMEIGNLIVFIQYGVQILISVLQIAMLFFFLPRAQVSAERVLEVLDTDVHIQNPDHPRYVSPTSPIHLQLDQVSFGFKGAERQTLSDINLEANPGDTLAIIGGTGSGKTTLANLIPRLYEASSGAVRINGVDVRDMDQDNLRQLIAYAPQKAVLFSGTIRSNMLYGRLDAKEEDIWQALDIAQADFVKDLDLGLEARVEAGGRNFSGGQRQRLSIARAIVSQPSIYIFDDSFSALDFKTDAKLRQALSAHTQDAIVIIIAQRVNTVQDADQIIVLDQGEIVGRGSHEDLCRHNAVYQDIVKSQSKEDE